MANNAVVGMAVTGSSIGSGPLLQYIVAALHWPAMTEAQAAGAVIVVAGLLHGVVALIGPVATALSARIVKLVQPKEVSNA